MSNVCQFLDVSGIRLQGLNRRLYKKIAEYFSAYKIRIFRLNYEKLIKAKNWKDGVNEKTFLDD